MERLIHHVYQELCKEFDVLLVGPEGAEAYAYAQDGVVSICPLTPLPGFLACLQWKAARIALRHKPDLILAGSGLAAPAAYLAVRLASAPVACFLHGLDVIAASKIYRKLFLPAVRRCDLLIANSENTRRLVKVGTGREHGVEVLNPGVDIPGQSTVADALSFRRMLGALDRTLLLSVGRLSPRKGLVEFIERVLPVLVSQRPELLLVIIGEEPRHALASIRGESERIQEATRRSGMQGHVTAVGAVSDDVLAKAYRECDLLVFPVRELHGDVEGFGMVAIEAAAHGLPTVAFASGGVPDAVRHGVSGYLVPPDDYTAMSDTIVRYLAERNREAWRIRCSEFARTFGWDRFGVRLRDLCVRAIERHRQ
jgi:phosphatidylinositol alpha-1,6-mannosyltransferase